MADQDAAAAHPVFVLCSARSGSTLLRFILDAHPALACPPETSIPALSAQLATVWSLVGGVPLSTEQFSAPPVISEDALAGTRHAVDLIINSYTARRGRQRYCDKNLGTARFVDLLVRLYPEARFLCLYRHPMDMIVSAMEACPWGITGFGFDPYAASSPGNIVLALARYWNDNTAAILDAEESFPRACHRIRYEDLVTDPEGTADGIFRFLGEAADPGITQRCFTAERERSGVGDYKIWYTTGISAASMGRGWNVPAERIPPPVLDQMNAMAAQLGYIEVDRQWGATAVPADVRAGANALLATGEARDWADGPGAALVGQRLSAGIARLDDGFRGRWGRWADALFGIVVSSAGRQVRWYIDLAAQQMIRSVGGREDGTEWDVRGPDQVWETVLTGGVNLGVALRGYELRYCDTGGDSWPSAAETRIGMLADLLGLANWPAVA